MTDMLDRDGEFPGVAAASQRDVWEALSPDPNSILKVSPARLTSERAPNSDSLRAARQRVLGPSLSLSYRSPLTIVRGAGQFLFDPTGRAYLDMVNNVAHVGHCHPRVVRAGARQMSVFNTNTRYLHDAIVEFGERLTSTLPEPLSVCFFVCSGSEANELALRMARALGRHRRHRGARVLPRQHPGPGRRQLLQVRRPRRDRERRPPSRSCRCRTTIAGSTGAAIHLRFSESFTLQLPR